jgi:NAD(P)-dependent dehydrogenase (short-subunit alcohol dehydrogenase family)/acyl carrier protein
MRVNEDLGLDSIKMVEVLSLMAERLGRAETVPPAEALGAATLGELAEILAASSSPGPEPARPRPAKSRDLSGESTADLIFEVVARETGYPRDMLNLAMNLESDLGLDSIKKVEIISALLEERAGAGLTVPAPETFREVRTLGELAEHLEADSPPARPPALDNFSYPDADTAPAASRPESEISAPFSPRRAPEPEISAPPQPDSPLELNAVRRGPGRPPKNRFNPPPASGEAEAKPAEQTTAYQVEAAPLTLTDFSQAARPEGEMILVADESPLAEALAEHYIRRSGGGAVRRFTWQSAGNLTEAPENLGSLVMVGPEEAESLACPREAFRILKTVGPALKRAKAAGRPALALGLTFGGGAFGFASVGPASAGPAEAALAGLFKTAAREWPDVMVRVVDLPREANLPAAGRYLPAILTAAAAEGAPAEMGFLAPDRCVALRLRPYRLKNIRVRHLKAGQTVLVTGGARGVTAAALRELARSWSPHLVILGRTPLVSDEPDWLKGLTDEAAIRQALWEMAENKPEPRELARAGARLMAEREVRANLAALEKTGAQVTYLSGDFGKEEAVRSALAEIKLRHGPIYGFIHGAGVLADSLILDKDESDFDLVFNTKARLARLILDELEGQPLNLAVFFSSSTARFGRRGQADYAAGNEYLNKLAVKLAQNRPGPKCLSVNWGPWAGGMVGDPLARLFQEEGVGLISLSEGARLFASLAGTPKHDPVEVVVLGRGTRLEGLAWGGPESLWARG